MSKRKLFVYILTIVFVASIVFTGTPVVVNAAGPYYVDGTNGNDNNSGTSTGTAFRTIQKAATVAQAGETVYIRGGTYRETVTPTYSGTSGAPITFQNYNGESVTVSGLDQISSGWSQYSGSIYRVSVSMGLGDEDQVFASGAMCDWARWPNNTDGDLFTSNASNIQSGSMTSITDSSMPNQSSGYYNGAVVWGQTGYMWTCWGATITSSGSGTIGFSSTYVADNPGVTQGETNHYYIAGKLGLLDTAKEWYYDGTYLYIQVSGGGNPGSTVEYKARKYGFDLSSKTNITVRGINLFGASAKLGSYDTLDGVTASYISHENCRDTSWVPNVSTGIEIVGDFATIKNCNIGYSSGYGIVTDYPTTVEGYTIDNNYIHHINYNGTYACGIGPDCVGNTKSSITRNTMYTFGRSAISISENLYANILYNDMYDAMRLTDDGGEIYSGGGSTPLDYRNSIIAYNKIHDNPTYHARGLASGLYYDDSSENLIDHHNVIYNISYDGARRVGGVVAGSIKIYNTTAYNVPTLINYHGGGSADVQNSYTNQSSGNFVNAGSGDFRLAGGASAINAGSVISPWTNGYVTTPDLGAYEYGGSNGVSNWTAGVGSTLYFADGTPSGGATPTPTPTPTPGGDTTVDFEDRPSSDTALTGSYGGITWSSSAPGWLTSYWAGYNHYVLINSGSTSTQTMTFTLPADKVLKNIVATGQAGTIVISSSGNTTQTFYPTTSYQTFNTGWTTNAATVTVQITNSYGCWDTVIDSLAYGNGGGATPTPTPTPSGSNLALNKSVTASSIEGTGYEASKAVDGNTSTRWASQLYHDPEWIYVDLGSTYSISRVKLTWETAYGSSYKIQTSSDASTWTDIYSTTTGNGSVDDLTGLSGSGRYVRMYGTVRGSPYGYSLYEFEVY